MPTLLKIDVSPRGEQSVSRLLGNQFEADWGKHHPNGEVIGHDLAESGMPFVDITWISAAFSPAEGHTSEQKTALAISDELIKQLELSDHYLITTPMFNFGLPAILKAWVDNAVRAGKTFKANTDGSYTGLLTGKKATLIISSAGVYDADTPAHSYDFITPYLRHILAFIGVTDVTVISAGGTYAINGETVTLDNFAGASAAAVTSAATR